jgi:hypothetical protein
LVSTLDVVISSWLSSGDFSVEWGCSLVENLIREKDHVEKDTSP